MTVNKTIRNVLVARRKKCCDQQIQACVVLCLRCKIPIGKKWNVLAVTLFRLYVFNLRFDELYVISKNCKFLNFSFRETKAPIGHMN